VRLSIVIVTGMCVCVCVDLYLSQLFRKNPKQRPTTNQILHMPLFQRRVSSLLSSTMRVKEFSHPAVYGDRGGGRGNGGGGRNGGKVKKAAHPSTRKGTRDMFCSSVYVYVLYLSSISLSLSLSLSAVR